LYFFVKGAPLQPNSTALLFPLLVVILAGLGLGFGLLFTSMTTKYRDLVFLLAFGVQLAMYATPVIYPLSEVPADYQWLAALNPMTSIIETFKYGFLGKGTFQWTSLLYSGGFMLVLLLFSMAVFNRTEKNFMDTV
jgi:lipopolysaccharide transport system permease protein